MVALELSLVLSWGSNEHYHDLAETYVSIRTVRSCGQVYRPGFRLVGADLSLTSGLYAALRLAPDEPLPYYWALSVHKHMLA